MGLTLYSMPSSGNSYKARLLLAHLGLPYTHVGMEYLTPELDAAHGAGTLPFAKLPVLELDDGTRLPESNAILCYLAEGTDWLPADRLDRARALAWMFWEQNQHEGVIAVRAALLTYPHRAHLATPERLAELLDRGNALLAIMERRLAGHDWIATQAPTVADLSLYAYTHSAEEKGGFDLGPFPAVRAWLDRVARLPGHVGLTDIPA
ncbi:glutathione S-transferase family protein [Palleronia sp. KMU-117]|uniref:glutathione S-transferase family protein n=1 Tax=Palleronia sp. KMU-117 TaxID=3434108 RepID=UPI003D71591D